MDNSLQKILQFITKAEKLKLEMRHSWLSNHRQESVAEHTWRMSLMAVLLRNKLEKPVDLEKVLKMIIIHDLVEIEAGDVYATDVLKDPSLKDAKQEREQLAINNIKSFFGNDLGEEIFQLWHEFEDKITYEAKFANALDKMEVQIQHNHAPINTWEEIEFKMVYMMDQHVAFDKKLSRFKDLIVNQAEEMLTENGIEIEKYRN